MEDSTSNRRCWRLKSVALMRTGRKRPKRPHDARSTPAMR